MKWKKIFSSLLVSAFIFGVPAVEIDVAPVTNTVSAAISRSEVRQRQYEFERAREDYERAKIRYNRASSRRERDSIGLRDKLNRMERARQRYESALREYTGYNENRRRNEVYRRDYERRQREQDSWRYRNGHSSNPDVRQW